MIDNVATHPTPEGLLLSFTPAGLMPRVSAWLLDLLFRSIAMSIVGLFGIFFGQAGVGLIAIGFFLINWLYPVYFEVYRQGMTPGKKSQGIYVCHDDGTPITLSSSMTRNLLRVADFLPFAFLAGVFSILFSKKSQRIGDLVAGTMVVYGEQDEVSGLFRRVYGTASSNSLQDQLAKTHATGQQLPEAALASIHATALFDFPLYLREQQALLSFAERSWFLSEERQLELIQHLSPLLTSSVNHAPALFAESTESSPTSSYLLPKKLMQVAVFKRIEQIVGTAKGST